MPSVILVTRPIDESIEFAKALQTHGLKPLIHPLLHVETISIPWEKIEKPDAIILTSRQALKQQNVPSSWQDIPVFCVGDKTALGAKDAGFTSITSGHQGANHLLSIVQETIPPDQRLLYLRGESVMMDIEELLSDNYIIQSYISYRTLPSLEATRFDRHSLGDVHTITLFSPQTARILDTVIRKNALFSATSTINILCLSGAVVESVLQNAQHDYAWKAVYHASLPTQESMIEKILDMMRTS